MFTLPPWPPKDYVLRNVAKAHQSSAEFTPIAIPRLTQTNLAKYLYPIRYKDSDKVKPEIKDVHPKIVENWVNKARAWWVDKPGLYQFERTGTLDGGRKNDPVFQHKEKVFNRPFIFEMDCMEFLRLKQLQEKTDKECQMKCDYMTGLRQAKLRKKKNEETLKVTPCAWQPPFWWKDEEAHTMQSAYVNDKPRLPGLPVDQEARAPSKSWQETPSYFRSTDDPCVRRKELLLVGLPFHNEGCNWYYKNYPPPKIKFKPQRFGK